MEAAVIGDAKVNLEAHHQRGMALERGAQANSAPIQERGLGRSQRSPARVERMVQRLRRARAPRFEKWAR